MSELNYAKGYRSKYINALNDAVKQNKIVGGDVTPIVTDSGTMLKVTNEKAVECRFQAFPAIVTKGGVTYPTIGIADGCLFAYGEIVTLKNGLYISYAKKGLSPKGSGWYLCGTPPTSSKEWTISICKVFVGENVNFYILATFDEDLAKGLPTEIQEQNPSIETVAKIATATFDGKIKQFVTSDVFLSSGGGTSNPHLLEMRTNKRTINGAEYDVIEVYVGKTLYSVSNGLLIGQALYSNDNNPSFNGIAGALDKKNIEATYNIDNGDGWLTVKVFTNDSRYSGRLGIMCQIPTWYVSQAPTPMLNINFTTKGANARFVVFNEDDGHWYTPRPTNLTELDNGEDLQTESVLFTFGSWNVKNSGGISVVQDAQAPFRVSCATGGEYLYAMGEADTSLEDQSMQPLVKVTDDTELTHESELYWCAIPILAYFDAKDTIIGCRSALWNEIPMAYTHSKIKAVMHASLHYDNFVKE